MGKIADATGKFNWTNEAMLCLMEMMEIRENDFVMQMGVMNFLVAVQLVNSK
jgi:hypothetical protein